MYHGVLPWANNSKRLSSCQCLRLERHDRDRELRGPGEIITKGNVAHLQGWTNGLFRPFNAPRGSHKGRRREFLSVWSAFPVLLSLLVSKHKA
jgi:hypothetical protein